MSLGKPTTLAMASQVADALVAHLAFFTVRIAVAGSIRRQCPEVRDIELVVIPRFHFERRGQQDLLGQEGTVRVNLLHQAVDDLVEAGRVLPIKPGTSTIKEDPRWESKADAKYWRLWLPKPQLQVDVFLASPETWGSVFTIRTGPADFSQALVSAWRRRGGRFYQGRVFPPCSYGEQPYSRTQKENYPLGPPFDTPEEEDIFRVCGFRWVSPELRRGRGDLVELHGGSRGDPVELQGDRVESQGDPVELQQGDPVELQGGRVDRGDPVEEGVG